MSSDLYSVPLQSLRRPPRGPLFRLVRQMAEHAERPEHWWLFNGGKNPLPKGKRAEDYVSILDNVVVMARVDFDCQSGEARRVLILGSDRYKASEIPMDLVDQAKRAFLGGNEVTPEISVGINRVDGKDYVDYRAPFVLPLGFIDISREVLN